MNLSSPGKDIHANKYADHFSEWFCKCNSRNISDFEKERHFSRGYIKQGTLLLESPGSHFSSFFRTGHHLNFTLFHRLNFPLSIIWMKYFTHSMLFIVCAFVRSNCGELFSFICSAIPASYRRVAAVARNEWFV